MKSVRCAIYTRKSSEEGLEQACTSLDAQREACAAYILSQASEGWSALPEIYDDGGLSGGTLERPALQRLLAEVRERRVDIIVVYKVDRLTRSLLDFSKLVEAFDAAGTSFVSVTQSFNTTTSMGRLTLNMLLSFAQFEREVTAERIRDKIAASKAKGMWMGGTPPLGYAPEGRTLTIVEDQAAIVRDIFDRYLAHGNVREVSNQLEREGIRSPRRQRLSTDKAFGGCSFSRGQLYSLLRCPTYVGEIHHRGSIYPALHPPIIDRDTWERVQAMLTDNRQGERRSARTASPSMLAGKVVDAAGQPLLAVHATKGTTRYRYYVSRDLHRGVATSGMRIPARELEAAVVTQLVTLFDDALALIATSWLEVQPSDVEAFASRCSGIPMLLGAPSRLLVTQVISQVRIYDQQIEIDCSTAAIASALQVVRSEGAPTTITLTSQVRLTRSGRAMRLVQSNGSIGTATPNTSLIKLLIKARRWWGIVCGGTVDLKTLATTENVSAAYITRVLRLAFLSPQVVDAILAGTVSAAIDGAALTATKAIPPLWSEQARGMLSART